MQRAYTPEWCPAPPSPSDFKADAARKVKGDEEEEEEEEDDDDKLTQEEKKGDESDGDKIKTPRPTNTQPLPPNPTMAN